MTPMATLGAAKTITAGVGYGLIFAANEIAGGVGGVVADWGPAAAVLAATAWSLRLIRNAYNDATETHNAERAQLIAENGRLREQLAAIDERRNPTD